MEGSVIDQLSAIVMAVLFLAYLREQRKQDRETQAAQTEALTQLTSAIEKASNGRDASEARFRDLVNETNEVIKENTKSFDRLSETIAKHDSDWFGDDATKHPGGVK